MTLTMFSYGARKFALAMLAAGALVGAVQVAQAQTTDAARIERLERQLAQSLQHIEQLARRVAELERQAAPAPAGSPTVSAAAPAAPAASEPSQVLSDLRESVNQLTAGLARNNGADTGLPVHGFLDVGAGWSGRGDPSKLKGFNAGSMDLYLTPQISNRLSALVEMVFEFNEEGAEVDMERLQIGYSFNDSLTLWGGRFHTPIGYWNTAFHHGTLLQTSISRPSFLEFEDRGGLLPAHSVGLLARGKTQLGEARLHYDAFLANGPSIAGRRLHPNTSGDDNGGKLWGLSLALQPRGAFSDLSAGINTYATNVNAYDSASQLRSSTRSQAAGAFLAWNSDTWEVLTEYHALRNITNGIARRSNLGYAQVGRSFGALTPYVRLERAALAASDPYLQSLQTGRPYSAGIAGLRYALDGNAALKFEVQQRRLGQADVYAADGSLAHLDPVAFRRALVQLSIGF